MRFIFIALVFLLSCAPSVKDNFLRIDQLSTRNHENYSAVVEIDFESVNDLIKENKAILIDVRTEKEIEISLIPGEVLKKDFQKSKNLYKNKIIIPYCTIGYRSGLYSKELISMGFNALNFRGGILSWVNSGGELVKPSGDETNKLHIYGKKWNIIPKNIQSIW